MFIGALLCIARILAGCVSSQEVRERAADVTYLAEHLRCVDREPSLSFDAPQEARRAAHARIDVCRADVRRRWGITETAARKDGGA
jgi:outer membrane murein-binding lipoprotein Lpp